MQSNRGEKQLPRFHKDFIGIGHQLEQRRKERRKIELQQRAMANRVIFLQKEDMKAQKSLIKKRQQYNRMMGIAERQAQQQDLKNRLILERQRQLEIARQENRLRRLMHKQNQQHSLALISQRNSLDYKIAKKQLLLGQSRKKQQSREDLAQRQERYFTLNLKKQQGRSRIDKFFKHKNLEHTKTYKQKIAKEEGNTLRKLDTIKKLGEIETVLRKKLEESSMRASQMDQILGDFSQVFKQKSSSRLSVRRSYSNTPQSVTPSPTLITSMEGQLLSRGDVEQNTEQNEQGGASERRKTRRKNRNKNVNRYRQYQLI